MDVSDSDQDRWVYLGLLSEEAKHFGLDILAWCLMKNHVHFVVPQTELSCTDWEGFRTGGMTGSG